MERKIQLIIDSTAVDKYPRINHLLVQTLLRLLLAFITFDRFFEEASKFVSVRRDVTFHQLLDSIDPHLRETKESINGRQSTEGNPRPNLNLGSARQSLLSCDQLFFFSLFISSILLIAGHIFQFLSRQILTRITFLTCQPTQIIIKTRLA